MKKKLISLAVLALFLHISSSAQPQGRSRLDTVQLQSRLVNVTLPYYVILPTDYRASRTTRFPVLYLLHGLSGHSKDWITRTNVADYAAQYRMIVVTPEGNDGWYVDSASVPTDKYETYILQELIPDVQKRYRTIEARYGRAIAGLSMGGYGAFKFALKYPGLFALAASMSGAFGVARYTEKETGSGAPWETLLRLFGPVGSQTRKVNDPFSLISEMPPVRISALPYFYFDCGTEDSAVIFNANRELDELMLRTRIPHEFRELPGNHSWAYWDTQVQEVLKIAAQKMHLPPAKAQAKSNK